MTGSARCEMIRVLEWREAAFLILLVLVLVTVAVIDAISRRLRAAITGCGGSGLVYQPVVRRAALPPRA